MLTTSDIDFIYNELRKASVIWSGRKEALALARRRVFERRTREGKPVYKYHWQCAKCAKWFRDEAEMEVDHIIEIGGKTAFNGDWNETINRIFPRPVEKHLQVLCRPCHERKTRNYLNARDKWQRKKE